MILYQYKCNECNYIFDEMSTVEERANAICPKCKNIATKLMSVSCHNINFCPHWDYELAPRPVYLTSRNSITKVANMLGNYSDAPFTKRESGGVKVPNKQSKQTFFREHRKRKGEF